MKDANELRRIISNGEAHNVEFKVKFDADKVGQALCALANDWPQIGHGTFIIGVDDKTKAEVDFSESLDKIQQDISNICRAGISPQIAPIIYIVTLDKPIVVVEMANCNEKPYRYKNHCYIRIGTTTRQAGFEEETELSIRSNLIIARQTNSSNSSGIFRCDSPPTNLKWVGRASELQQISNPNFKVVFITGIGGQGKSGLASHYVRNIVGLGDEYEYWDWRDFKEEGYRFNTKIISIIERLTYGKISAAMLKDQISEELIDTLFHYLGNRRIVFVFDNIDRYIDSKTLLPTDGVGKLVDLALTKEHNCRFIFTCRPYIRYVGVGFNDLNLDGLTLQNTIELFEKYKLQMKSGDVIDLAKQSYQLTGGHSLWLNLIAAQALRGKDTAIRFLDGIKFNSTYVLPSDNFSVLSEYVLKTVWDNLSQNQRILLRGMSEMVRAETEANLAKMLNNVLHYSKFKKALEILKALNLIVMKSSLNDPDLLELHPLVKSFIVNKYNLQERTKYIQILVEYYNRFIVVFRKEIDSLTIGNLEAWVDKIELNINEENYQSALISLEEVDSPLFVSGRNEEYLRVAHLLFTKLNLLDPNTRKYKYFYSQFERYIKTSIEFGISDEVVIQLGKFEKSCTGREMIEYYDYKCYNDWFQQKFEDAIKWGQRYWDNLKTYEPNCGIPHTLLLSWRDSGEPENVKKALNGFLQSETLKEILSGSSLRMELGHAFYGNIGRCLWYQKQMDSAMICYKKSLQLLNSSKLDITGLNKGYAYQWIADILMEKHDHDNASLFYRNALVQWSRASPLRARIIQEKLSRIFLVYPDSQRVSDMAESEIEEHCNKYLAL